MPITSAVPTSFKQELLLGFHAFGNTTTRAATTADTFKIALFTSNATLGSTTTIYSLTNEVSGAGYTTGGSNLVLAQTATTTGTTAWLDFNDVTWSTSTITAAGALIYNSTRGNRAVAVISFGTDVISNAGDFTVIFPTADSTNAIIRIT